MDFVHHLQIPVMDGFFGQHIQCGKWLIQQGNAAGKQIRPKQSRPLAHAPGQLGRILFLGALQAELPEIGKGSLPCLPLLHSFYNQRKGHIVLYGPVGKEQVLLQHIAHPPGASGYVLSVQKDMPCVRP